MDREEQRLAAGRALVAKVLADLVAKEVRTSRRVLEPTLVPGEKVKGVLPDGRVVGAVQLTEQPASAFIVDREALMAYVRRVRPDEIVTVEYIRESYLSHLKEMAREQLVEDTYGGEVVDAQGEIVPGLDIDYGTPRYTPKPSPQGIRAIEEVLSRLLGPDLAKRLELTVSQDES